MIRTKHYIYLGGILGLGVIIRLLFLVTPSMDSDQAVTGLMARHILGGEFPFFFYKQDYCGSIEAYLVSTIFLLFGANRFTLGLTIGLQSIFLVVFLYTLTRTMADKKTALLAALFSALPSYFLIFHSVLARAAYIEIPIFGVVLFSLILKIIDGRGGQNPKVFLLGFFCGLGIWTHLLIVFYLPPVFLFWLIKDRWFWIRSSLPVFVLGLILGGGPLWVHNTVHPLATWHYLFDTSGGGEPFFESLKAFFLYRFPEALGVRYNETNTFFIPYFSHLLYLIYLVSFLLLLFLRRKNMASLFKRKPDSSNGPDILLCFLYLFPIIFALSGFAAGHTSRYLQPLFSVLPFLLALLVMRLWSYSSTLGFFFLVLYLFSNVFGIMTSLPLISPRKLIEYRQARENDQRLFGFLREKQIKFLYTPDYWTSLRLTFDAQETILFAQPVGDRYPLYTDRVDREPKAAFLLKGENREFEETLKNIGGSFQKSRVNGYSVYYDFSPPPYGYRELDPSAWVVSSNDNPAATQRIFDRDRHTHWSTHGPQRPGTYLQIDLGAVVSDLGRLTLLSGNPAEAPRGLLVEVSRDGRTWQTVGQTSGFWGTLFWAGPHPFSRPQQSRMDLVFSPLAGRYVRLTQLGQDPEQVWSVSECFLYRAESRSQEVPEDMNPLISFLDRYQAGEILMDPWTQSRLPRDWRAKQRFKFPDPEDDHYVRMLSNPVFVVEKDKASTLVNFFKQKMNRPFEQQEISGREVFFFPPSRDRYQPLASKGWRFQTNYNPGKASWAADGKLITRWTTEKPQEPGAFFQVDLGKREEIARIRILVGNSRSDFPRGYVIQSSMDGQTWSSLEPLLSPVSLYWTGETLLKGGADLDFILPPTPMRFLKITQTGKDKVFYWSIHELELYRLMGSR